MKNLMPGDKVEYKVFCYDGGTVISHKWIPAIFRRWDGNNAVIEFSSATVLEYSLKGSLLVLEGTKNIRWY